MFQYSWLYISVKKKKFWDNVIRFRKSVIRRALCSSVEVAALLLAEKILSEYCNNRILWMSLKTWFCSLFFLVTKSSLTNLYCFNVHGIISLWKGGVLKIIYRALERAWLDVYLARVSRLQLFRWPRKSSLNIETIEFC